MNTERITRKILSHLVPTALIAASGLALGQVDTFDFADEDLLLAVQATSGSGASQNLFLKLGNTVTIKNSPNRGVVANIGSALSDTFDDNWFTRTDLRFGVIGNRSNFSPTSDPGVSPQEPGRTLYVSIAASSAGSGALRGQLGSSALSQVCTRYAGLRFVLTQADVNTTDDFFVALPSGATILDSTLQPVSWANSWTNWNPSGSGAVSFVSLSPNVEAAFGSGSEVLVDVQRMVPSTPTTYVVTVGIDSNGNVRLFTSAPASAYTTWMASFPAITAPADKLEAADPDGDEIENLLEFVLNGNPSVSGQSILPTLNASGSDFVFNFTRRADSASEATQVFEYSTNLVDWTTKAPIAIPTTPGTSGFVTVGANTGTAPNQLQAVSITIPKGSDTQLFGRLKAVK